MEQKVDHVSKEGYQMIRMTEQDVLWRNFFFAKYDNYYKPDYDEFEARVGLIANAKENLMKQILSEFPNNELIKEAKEEIEFQKEQLSETIEAFIKYCNENGYANTDNKEQLLEDIVNNDFNSGLWKILEDWKPITQYVNSVIDKLEGLHDCTSDLREDLSKLMMDNMRDKETRRLLAEKLHLR